MTDSLSNINWDSEEEVLLELIKTCDAFEYASERLRDSEDFVYTIFFSLHEPKIAKFLSPSLRNNRTILTMCSKYESVLPYMDYEQVFDRSIIYNSLHHNPLHKVSPCVRRGFLGRRPRKEDRCGSLAMASAWLVN